MPVTTDQALVQVRSQISLPLEGGESPSLITFTGFPRHAEHFVLRYGQISSQHAPLVRVHSECITGDLFRSQRCDCGAQLEEAKAMLAAQGGLMVYLRQEGRGIGLYAKVDAYRLQDQGLDTYAANEHLSLPADARDYLCAAQMLEALGVQRLRLITNNPEKARQLKSAGLSVVAVVPTTTFQTAHNRQYLEAKRSVTHHRLHLQPVEHGEAIATVA